MKIDNEDRVNDLQDSYRRRRDGGQPSGCLHVALLMAATFCTAIALAIKVIV